MAEMKAELLRWMFVFWIGGVTANVGILCAATRMLKT